MTEVIARRGTSVPRNCSRAFLTEPPTRMGGKGEGGEKGGERRLLSFSGEISTPSVSFSGRSPSRTPVGRGERERIGATVHSRVHASIDERQEGRRG